MKHEEAKRKSQPGQEIKYLESNSAIHENRQRLRDRLSQLVGVTGKEAEQMLQENNFDIDKLLDEAPVAPSRYTSIRKPSPSQTSTCLSLLFLRPSYRHLRRNCEYRTLSFIVECVWQSKRTRVNR